jgi:hypothetical protein
MKRITLRGALIFAVLSAPAAIAFTFAIINRFA